MDPRWQAVADVLVNYSTALQPGERVMIAMGGRETLELAQGLYQACVRAGAYPQALFHDERMRHALLKHGDEAQLKWLPEVEAHGMDWADVYFGLRAGGPLSQFADIPASALAANQAARGKISTLRWQKTRWCLVRVPCAALAMQADASLERLTDMFFAACLLDYQAESAKWQAQAQRLQGADTVRIVAGEGTDLSFSVAGRKWLVFDGKINLPDGEIYTAPVNSTLNGKIHFEIPGIFGGKLMRDIRLAWRDGELIHASAATNQEYLRRILDADAGASRLGEFAFGLNPHIDRFCGDILYDEKIAGTLHVALGRAYPECGGLNQSRIHWDLVKDMRFGGTVIIDGAPIFSGGRLRL